MADETLISAITLRGGTIPPTAFPPGSDFVFMDALTTRSDDVNSVAKKASAAANGAYDAQVQNDLQDIQISSLDNRVTNAEGVLREHGARISQNESDIGQLQTDVAQVQSDVSALKTDVTAIQGDYVSKTATALQGLAGPINVTTSYSVNGVKVVGDRQLGWNASTGTGVKGGMFVDYTYTAGAAYSQTEVQAIGNGLKEVRKVVKALQDLMTYHGLTN